MLRRVVHPVLCASAAHPILVGTLLLTLCELARLRWRERRLVQEAMRQASLRLGERAGRTAAEKKLRQVMAAKETAPTAHAEASAARHLTYRPIGHLQSCFVERRGTPRQGMLVPAARARLKVNAHVVQPKPALEGLEGFSHVWLLFDFHENTNANKLDSGRDAAAGGAKLKTMEPAHAASSSAEPVKARKPKQVAKVEQVRAKVHPPGLGGGKIGLFATRTPHRPNPIGLSVARLISVEGDTLVLGGADLIDGTPILDVKPYLLHDVQADAAVPSWCENRTDASLIVDVRFSEAAREGLEAAVARHDLRFYADATLAREAIEQALQLDIRSVHQGRGQAVDGGGGQEYTCRFDTLELQFTTFATHVLVDSCRKWRAARA